MSIIIIEQKLLLIITPKYPINHNCGSGLVFQILLDVNSGLLVKMTSSFVCDSQKVVGHC